MIRRGIPIRPTISDSNSRILELDGGIEKLQEAAISVVENPDIDVVVLGGLTKKQNKVLTRLSFPLYKPATRPLRNDKYLGPIPEGPAYEYIESLLRRTELIGCRN